MIKLSNVSFNAVLHCTGHCSLLLHFMGHTSTATNMLWPTMHRRPPALGFTTFNFTFYENPHLSLKKRDFPVTLQKCKYKNILT